MRIKRIEEPPEKKGKRIYLLGNVKIESRDEFEIMFSVKNDKHSQVSFNLKTFELKCFNAQCSRWRKPNDWCYHKYAAQQFIINNKKVISSGRI